MSARSRRSENLAPDETLGTRNHGPGVLAALAKFLEDGFKRADDLVLRRAALAKRQLEVEGLVRRPVGEYERLRTPRLRLGGRLSQLLARRAALAGNLLEECRHFLGRLLPNYLQQQRLAGNVGQPTQ